MTLLGWYAIKQNKNQKNKIIYSLTSHVYNYLTMCRWIVDVGLNYRCCVAVMLGAISLSVISLCGLQEFLYHKINQIKLNLRTLWVFQKTSPFLALNDPQKLICH